MTTLIDRLDGTEVLGLQFDGVDENRNLRNTLEQSGHVLGEVGVSPATGRLIFNTEDGPVILLKGEWVIFDKVDGDGFAPTTHQASDVDKYFEVKSDA